MHAILVLALTLAAVLGSGAARGADAPATITILEGEAQITRGVGRGPALEGAQLAFGDIVETAAAAFAQIEFADQSVLQIGPGTRLMVLSSTTRKKTEERWLYVMNGWIKWIGAPKRDAAAATPRFDVRTPLVEIAASPAVIVLQATPTEVALFVERGELRIGERSGQGAALPLALKAGESYLRSAGARGVVNTGSSAEFRSQMPRAFKDSLPLRIDRYRDKDVPLPPAADIGYADVEIWLKSEPWLRKQLMPRWRVKVKEPAFRSALVANLSSHPEWDPILFPEKYQPKPAPPPPRPAPASAAPPRPTTTPTPAAAAASAASSPAQ